MAKITDLVLETKHFEWDKGNRAKNYRKHGVTREEAEQVFLNEPLLINPDIKHSQTEKRYHGLGRTDNNRPLFVAFTIRNSKIRVISARNQDKKERSKYEEAA